MQDIEMGRRLERVGDLAGAEAAYRGALPHEPMALYRLAMLLKGRLPDADLRALESALDGPHRARLLFGLGHVLDGRGEYERAAACFAEANGLVETDYDPRPHEQFVDALIGYFTPRFFRRFAGSGHPTRRPVFLFGMPRSGSTLLEQVLSGHPEIHGAGELPLARDLYMNLGEILRGRFGPAAVEGLARWYLDRLPGDRLRTTDKMPDNYLYLGLLAVLFPRATFIHATRDPRDVALSCWMTDFTSIRWANRTGHIVHRIRQHARLLEHWKGVLPVPLFEARYEETVAELEGTARRLLLACRLTWDPACLEFTKNPRAVRTASVAQVRQPLHRRSVARWKNYEPYLKDLFPDRFREFDAALEGIAMEAR